MPSSAEVFEGEIYFHSQTGTESKIPWSGFLSAVPWRDNLILMLSEYQGIVMFKRAFDPSDWEIFKTTADQKIAEAKR